MKKILVIGAAGRQGPTLLEQGARAGHKMYALARNPDKIAVKDANVLPLKGDCYSLEQLETAVGSIKPDVIISVIGHVDRSPDDLLQKSCHNIIEAAQKHGVQRIISLNGMACQQADDQPKFMDSFVAFLLRTLSRKVITDASGAIEVFRKEGRSVDWTVVRVPRITDGPLAADPSSGHYIGPIGKDSGWQVSRANLSWWMLHKLLDVNGEWKHKAPSLSQKA